MNNCRWKDIEFPTLSTLVVILEIEIGSKIMDENDVRDTAGCWRDEPKCLKKRI